jgi:hypothetical protein
MLTLSVEIQLGRHFFNTSMDSLLMNYMPLAQDICMKPAALHFQLKVECLTVLCRGKLRRPN